MVSGGGACSGMGLTSAVSLTFATSDQLLPLSPALLRPCCCHCCRCHETWLLLPYHRSCACHFKGNIRPTPSWCNAIQWSPTCVLGRCRCQCGQHCCHHHWLLLLSTFTAPPTHPLKHLPSPLPQICSDADIARAAASGALTAALTAVVVVAVAAAAVVVL